MQAHQVTHPAIALDGARLLAQLRALGEVGADPDAGGRTRIALTDDERAGRDLVVRWMRALDLDVRIDRIGNISAPCAPDPTQAAKHR